MSTGEDKTTDASLLSDDFVRELVAVGEVDLFVGIPTLNDAKTIRQVAQAVQAGFARHFPRERVVVVNCDGGSHDGTAEAFTSTFAEGAPGPHCVPTLRTIHHISTVYRGSPNSAAALRTIVVAADLLRAKACGVVSGDLTSINPSWIDNLFRPVVKEHFDLVSPIYFRHKFEGLLVSNVLYPLVRAAYGKGVREPLATEFALSGQMASQLLDRDFWQLADSDSSPEIWITTLALLGNFRVCQAFLGPKIFGEKPAAQDLVGTLRRAVGTLYRCLDDQASQWPSQAASPPLPSFGFEYEAYLKPVRINRKRTLQMFRTGVAELHSILKVILAETTLLEIQEAAKSADDDFRYSDELWVKTIYDFATAYHRSVISRDHIVQALAPLYRGRIGSFISQNHEANPAGANGAIEKLCAEYERLRPYLLARWNEK